MAEKRAAALSLDPTLLAELLGGGESLSLRDLLDPHAVATTAAELGHLTPSRAARDIDDLSDLLRTLGPLDTQELALRTREESREDLPVWLDALVVARRAFPVRIAGRDQWAAIDYLYLAKGQVPVTA